MWPDPEVITLTVFAAFATLYLGEQLTRNHGAAALCMCGAAFFIFRA